MSIIINITPYMVQLVLSLLIIGLLAKTVKWFGSDKIIGVQKFHYNDVSRMGGFGICISILIGIYLNHNDYPNLAYLALFLMIAFMPIFLGGLIEDITHKVSPNVRLILAIISAIATMIVTNINISRTDIILIDSILNIPGISVIITLLLISGFINAINIIDGFHGIASGAVIIMLVGIFIISYIVEDYLLIRLTLIIFIACIAFIFWNWPIGKIFLGDSGAYLLGIWVVVLGNLLINRSTEISPMAPVLIGSYPLIETIFTIYRRVIKRSKKISHPDGLHLHTIIYRRLIYTPSKIKKLNNKNFLNSRVAVYVWTFIAAQTTLSVIYFNNTKILCTILLLSIFFYVLFYKTIIKFKIPKLIVMR